MNINDIMLRGISQSQRRRNIIGFHIQEVPRVIQFIKAQQDDGCQGWGEAWGAAVPEVWRFGWGRWEGRFWRWAVLMVAQ